MKMTDAEKRKIILENRYQWHSQKLAEREARHIFTIIIIVGLLLLYGGTYLYKYIDIFHNYIYLHYPFFANWFGNLGK